MLWERGESRQLSLGAGCSGLYKGQVVASLSQSGSSAESSDGCVFCKTRVKKRWKMNASFSKDSLQSVGTRQVERCFYPLPYI